jgi:uncharacterized protein (DUF885 family)
MRIFSLAMAICLLLSSCGNNESQHTSATMDKEFDNYKEGFVAALWKMYPGWASSAGYHAYDSLLPVPDAANRQRQLDFCREQLDSLGHYDIAALSDNNKTDHIMIKNQLESTIWSINDFRAHEWNPAQYNVSEGFAEILNGTYDSLDTRLNNIFLRMQHIPAYYDAAKQHIKIPTEEHRQLAIEQNEGGTSVFTQDLQEALAKSHLSDAQKQAMTERAAAAVQAMKSYVEWLKDMKVDAPHSFRIGKELYARKFEYDIQSGYTAEQVYQKAVAHKKELHTKMAALAGKLWPKYMGTAALPADTLQLIRQVIDKISLKHTTPDSFQATIEQQIPVLTAFVKDHNLIYLDPSKPLVVRKEPAYMAGVAGASINAPGPYDKGGNTYYNVGSLAAYPPDRAESFLREYNYYTLQILNIHEAIPGHYAQLVYSNQSPSIIKSIFGNGAMVEGWAVYTELMMLESGYGNNEDEMWLMYYKWNLRSTCNTILDYDVHVNNLEKDAAMNLLVNEAFQQQAEATGKWRRVSLSQVQLCSYFTGFTEIHDFREELKKTMGDKFDLKAFHEKFLSYGSAPVKNIREMMLKEMEGGK